MAGWYKDRFKPHPTRVEIACLHCKRPIWLPKGTVGQRTTCGVPCRLELGRLAKEARRRGCQHCGKSFIPRTTQIADGQGLFCSLRCSTKSNGQLWTPEARVRATAAFKAAITDGRFVPRKGENHHQWTGGPKAQQRRRIDSGKSAEQLRRYRDENPHKIREFSARRHGRKTGRLPRGTVPRIGEAQKWKCAVCSSMQERGFLL